MGTKNWNTSTEATHRTSLAAWQWYQVGRQRLTVPGSAPPKLCDALLTRMLDIEMVVEEGGCVFASLGNYSWAALLYPLHVLHADSDGLRTIGWGGQNSAVEFAYVVNPHEWSVLTCTTALASAQGKIILQETEQPRSLLKYSLTEKCTSLSLDSLQRISSFLDLEEGGGRASLLRLVANAVFADDPDKDNIVAEISRRDAAGNTRTNTSAILLQDPLFEAAWDDMPRDEQLEFPDVTKEKTRGRVRRHIQARERNENVHLRRARKRLRTSRAEADPDQVDRGEPPLVPALGTVIGGADVGQDDPAAPAQGNVIGGADVGQSDPALAPSQGIIAQQRVPRGEPWGRVINGRPMFKLARTHDHGILTAITVTCNVHRHDGNRCNKSLSLGVHFTEAEAMRRIKAWCVAGLAIEDCEGARTWHMAPEFFCPRTVPESELKSMVELDALVG